MGDHLLEQLLIGGDIVLDVLDGLVADDKDGIVVFCLRVLYEEQFRTDSEGLRIDSCCLAHNHGIQHRLKEVITMLGEVLRIEDGLHVGHWFDTSAACLVVDDPDAS